MEEIILHIHPYLTFVNAKQAMEYYRDMFGAEIRYRQPLSKSSAENLGLSTDHLDDTTLYGEIVLNGQIIACADAVMGVPAASSLVSIMLDFDDEGAAKELFDRVSSSDDQRVTVPFNNHETGGHFAQVVDKYGVTWVISVGVASGSQSSED